MFSIAADNQFTVTVGASIRKGNVPLPMHDNLGKFDLDGIPTTPRGVFRIEFSFQIDANGILRVGVVKPRYRDPRVGV